MKILGIDPGYGIVGFGLIELAETDWEALDFGVITTDKGLDLPDRLVQIYEDICELIKEFKPNVIAIEELFFVQNVTTGIQVAEARGVILLAAAQAGLSIYEYGPSEVKAAITGYGKADKSQVQTMVQTILELKKKPQPDDAADALAVALTCGFNIV
ncbi:crossover junction endodeoxyribonuclease RuvC [Candidatus Peregrinibacteria bacterium]|jgi:crossover junction endodeoxyribonuclease RuvC|nr:crossover junction endodeoxyribonuclease RuvC [Candidatus Peregrinibacteria bacterium]